MWDQYVDYSSSAVGHKCIRQPYLFRGIYANNVKDIHTSAPGHISNSTEFI